MKKTVFFALAALAGLAVSCSEKPESGPGDEKQTYNTPESESCFYAAFANPADMLVWSKGDAVAVWEEGGSRSAYTAQSDGSSTILEGAATSKGSTYRALLPDDPGIALSGAEISFDIPDNQAPVKGSVVYNPAVALTTGAHRDFRFYGICGLVGFNIVRDDVTSVMFTGNLHETVAGSVIVDVTDPASQTWKAIASSDNIVMESEEPAFAPGRYCFAVLPQHFAEGFTISMNCADGTQAERICTVPFTIEQSKYLDAGSIDDIDSWGGNYTISTLAEFLFFVKNAASYDDEAVITLDCDIDLSGQTIAEISKFEGIFDGGGHSISNWTTDHPLFGEFSGTLTSLNIESNCTYTIPSDGDAAWLVRSNSGTVKGCVNRASMACAQDASFSQLRRIGAIVAFNSGRVQDCKNYGNITLTPAEVAPTTGTSPGGAQIIGGVAGQMSNAAGSAEISSCENHGDIIYSLDDRIGAWNMMGGVLGGTSFTAGRASGSTSFKSWAHGFNGTIKDCINNGNLTYHYNNSGATANNVLNLGGIAGYVEGSVEKCSNTGTVTADTWQEFGATIESYVRPLSVGGVVGRVTRNLTDCTNEGKVFFKGNISNTAVSEILPTGQIPQSAVGGVAAMAGDSLSTTSGCRNTGSIEVSAGVTITAGPILYIGGVSGYSASAVSSCGNEGDIKVTSAAYTLYVGGVNGFAACKNLSSSDNSGKIDINLHDGGSDTRESYYMRIGGVVGQRELVTVSACNNSGNITLNGGDPFISGSSSPGNYLIGGICGYGSKNGSYTVKGTASNYICNSGDITVTTKSGARVGGIEGQCGNSNNVQYARNTGNITVSSDQTNCYVGGIRSQSNAQLNFCINEGNITFTGSGNSGYVAGLTCTMGATKVNGCSNSGNVTYNRTTSSTSAAYASLGIAYAKCGNTNINFNDSVLDGTLTVNKASAETGIFAGLATGYAEVVTLGADSQPLTIRPTASVNGIAATAENVQSASFLAGKVNGSLTINNVVLSAQQ